MLLRFTLSHSVLGTVIIDEPEGWNDCVLILERNEDFGSLWEKFEGNFTFYGDNGRVNGGIDFIRSVINGYGPDATLEILAEISTDNITFSTVFSGLLALDLIKEADNNTAQIPIIPNDLRTKFKNRYETQVDLMSLTALSDEPVDTFTPSNIELTSQLLPMEFRGESLSMGLDPSQTCDYLQMSWNDVELEEFDEYFLLPQVSQNELPPENFVNEYAGEYRFIIQTNVWFSPPSPSTNPESFWVPVLNINGVETLFTYRPQPYYDEDAQYINSKYAEFEIDHTAYLTAQSSVRIYIRRITPAGCSMPGSDTLRWNGNFVDNGVVFPTQYFFRASARIIGNTEYPATQSDCVLLHDAGGYVMDRITGENQKFYSEYLGSPMTVYRQYDDPGCRWRNMLVKGLQLRQYSIEEKPFFLSFKQWWEGVNPILCLGLGYETINGEEVFRVENREFFYNPEIMVYLDNVSEIIKTFDVTKIPKTVKTGHKNWQSENISGIDDPQTKRTYAASKIQRTGTEITLESDFIAASLAIENTRRQTRIKSADYKFDNETFIIALSENEASPDDTFLPELDENFEFINNLKNSETRYNSVHTPARYFMRWSKFLFGGLQHYIGSLFKFTGGEGNYDMESNYGLSDGCDEYNGELSEKQDIEVTEEYVHRSESFEIKTKLPLDTYYEILRYKNHALGASQTDRDHKGYYIKILNYQPVGGQVTIQAWAIEDYQIQPKGSSLATQICTPEDPCEDSYLTEGLEEILTESGECLVLQ